LLAAAAKPSTAAPAPAKPLDVSGHRGIVAYEPTELVITARAGTPLAEIEALLAANNQMLPFEPPHFSEQTTLGGMVAAGLSGPRRPWGGSVRDAVLGVKLLNGRGEVLRLGGQVMKNVAGYDVSRLMVGAMGTLGVLLEVSVKVLPRPACERTLVFDSTTKPPRLSEMPISASLELDGRLYLRLSASSRCVEMAADSLGGEPPTRRSGPPRAIRRCPSSRPICRCGGFRCRPPRRR
jgi:glycolate oxidase FAD binding subunit